MSDEAILEKEQIGNAIDAYEQSFNKRKSIAMSYDMPKAKDKKKLASYIIRTIKRSIAASPDRLKKDE